MHGSTRPARTDSGSVAPSMKPEPTPSVAAPLWVLVLALMVAALVLWDDWTPWRAIAVVGGSTLLVIFCGLALLLRQAPSRRDRDELWQLFVDTARTDLQPFVVLWRLIRGRRR